MSIPARLAFLRDAAADQESWPSPTCPDFDTQFHPASVTSISLVFASGYIDNPASYFGHTLIELNYERSPSEARGFELDSSVNYGADATDDTSSPLYLLRGPTGGYTGSYSRNDYFLNTHLYTNATRGSIGSDCPGARFVPS